MSVITLSELKDYLQIHGTGRDARLKLIVSGLNDYLVARTGRTFTSASRDEKYRGNGTRTLVLNHYPVTTLTSIDEDGTTLDVSDPEVVELEPDTGMIVRTDGGVWRLSTRRIYQIVYTAGEAPPEMLKMAALQIGKYLHKGAGSETLRSGSFGRQQIARALSELPGVSEAIDSCSDSGRQMTAGVPS